MDEDKNKNEIEQLRQYIASAEKGLESAKAALSKLTGEQVYINKPSYQPDSYQVSNQPSDNVVEGVFNGENMIGPGEKIYPIPVNYASKSKLIEGDKLKLTIAEDGSFIFKQIGPAERKKVIGTLEFQDNAYHVSAEGRAYNVLYASVTYFKAKQGDRVTLIIPADNQSTWGAIDNVILEKDIGDQGEADKEIVMKSIGLSEDSYYTEPDTTDATQAPLIDENAGL
jgi:hypothetical protein